MFLFSPVSKREEKEKVERVLCAAQACLAMSSVPSCVLHVVSLLGALKRIEDATCVARTGSRACVPQGQFLTPSSHLRQLTVLCR